jgi:hypothetical protein
VIGILIAVAIAVVFWELPSPPYLRDKLSALAIGIVSFVYSCYRALHLALEGTVVTCKKNLCGKDRIRYRKLRKFKENLSQQQFLEYELVDLSMGQTLSSADCPERVLVVVGQHLLVGHQPPVESSVKQCMANVIRPHAASLKVYIITTQFGERLICIPEVDSHWANAWSQSLATGVADALKMKVHVQEGYSARWTTHHGKQPYAGNDCHEESSLASCVNAQSVQVVTSKGVRSWFPRK